MRRIVLVLVTVFSMLCLVACGGDTQGNVSTNGNEESVIGNAVNEPTAKPAVEATAEPTEEPAVEVTTEPAETPVAEATPEPTEEPVLYPGIDMESDLPGQQWLETFIGVIDEPKLVVFSDETGRKEIIEEGTKVPINPDTDMLAVYLPEGYKYANKTREIYLAKVIDGEYYQIFYLDSEKMREEKFRDSAIYVKYDSEEIALEFILKSE